MQATKLTPTKSSATIQHRNHSRSGSNSVKPKRGTDSKGKRTGIETGKLASTVGAPRDVRMSPRYDEREQSRKGKKLAGNVTVTYSRATSTRPSNNVRNATEYGTYTWKHPLTQL